MECKLINGDYVPDGLGGIQRVSDAQALLQRVLFRLTARRGQLPMLPTLGSRLYLLGREAPSQRLSAARQYVAEALAEEEVSISDVALSEAQGGHIQVTVYLDYQGTDLAVTLTT